MLILIYEIQAISILFSIRIPPARLIWLIPLDQLAERVAGSRGVKSLNWLNLARS